jgi:uncharacterized RDD family membrane protein YckC
MANDFEPLDTTIQIIAPENISFSYRLAGPFRRLPAVLIDVLICVVSIWAVGTLLFFLGLQAGVGLFFAFLFLLVWGYGGICETYLNGQTPGKMAMRIRVISTEGLPIDAQQAILRNLLRVVDIAMYFLVGGVAFLFTRRFQRLGDLAAGTMVVIEEKRRLRAVRQVSDPRIDQLLADLPATFEPDATMAEAIAGYIGRRDLLGHARRREVANHLAQPLIRKLNLPASTDPDWLMIALYKRVYG